MTTQASTPPPTNPTLPPLTNDLILRAARGEQTEKTPVWIMRQAGRYLPEFREARKKADFFTICQTPELACEVTLQPIKRYPELDAAIIFSDILVIPQALGLTVVMEPSKGPVLPNPIKTPTHLRQLISALRPNNQSILNNTGDETKNGNEDDEALIIDDIVIDVQKRLGYVFDAITLTRKKLDGKVPLIGFSGAPWTLMAYMVEGESSRTWAKAKAWLYLYPKLSHSLLSLLSRTIIDYLVGQVDAGAQLLQVFESHAGELGPDLFREFSLPYLLSIGREVKTRLASRNLEDTLPMIVFPKGAHYALEDLSGADSPYDVISLDWTIDIEKASTITRNRAEATGRKKPISLQGNLDPSALYGTNKRIKQEVETMLRRFGTQSYIANLGHGVYPDHDPEKVGCFISTVHSVSTTINEERNSVKKEIN